MNIENSNAPIVTGLIHANHGGEITDYLLNQLKDASTDVSLNYFYVRVTFPNMAKYKPE